MCASLNHSKKMKAEPSQLITQKPTENQEILTVELQDCSFCSISKTV